MKVDLFIFRIHYIRLHIGRFVRQNFAIFFVTRRFLVHRSSSPYWRKIEASDFWRLQLNGSLHRSKNFEESGTNRNPMVPGRESMVGAVNIPSKLQKFLIKLVCGRALSKWNTYNTFFIHQLWSLSLDNSIQFIQLKTLHVWIDGFVVW